MNVRLLLPKCRYPIGRYYCRDAYDYNKRMNMLQEVFNTPFFLETNSNIDLVITSNNFFSFPASYLAEKEYYINEFLIQRINSLTNKKNLIIGFDLENPRIIFNPYGGIPSIVVFLKPNERNEFKIECSIWECWNGCDANCFSCQSRIVNFQSNLICLLSCGDILFNCNKQLKKLKIPKVKVLVDLAHRNISQNLLRQWSNITSRIQNIADILIITQQFSNSSKIFVGGNYRLLWHNNLHSFRQKIIRKKEYSLVDISI